jgi:type I restriction enzyme, S subunit
MKRWPLERLGDVCDINPRLTTPESRASDFEVSFVPMAAIDETNGLIIGSETRRYGDVAKGYSTFREGDILFAKITPCMQNGKAAIARNLNNGFGFGSTEFHVLRPHAGLLPEWVFALIRQPSFRRTAESSFTGTAGQQRVPAEFLRRFPIPVPPLPEQERLVKLLDEADELRKLRAVADRRTAELVPALFHEMFGDPLDKRWPKIRLGDVLLCTGHRDPRLNPDREFSYVDYC